MRSPRPIGPDSRERQRLLSICTAGTTLGAMSDIDVVVIGGSAAGLSAALVLARARRRVLVVDSGAPRNGPAEHLHGFLSRDGLPPRDLLDIGRAEVQGYGGELSA